MKVTKKAQLYAIWQKDPNFNRSQVSKDIGLDLSSLYRYLREFRQDQKVSPTHIPDGVQTPAIPLDAIEKTEEQFLKILSEKKEMDIFELCDHLDASPAQVRDIVNYYRTLGYEVGVLLDNRVILSDTPLEEKELNLTPLGDKEIAFGIASDLHFGSVACQITALQKFCEILEKEGIKDVFVPGDIFAGWRVYPGQEHDVYAITADEQRNSAIVNLPEGFNWWMIGGNHDYSFIKNANGHNVLRSLASKREDIHYLGFDQVVIPVLNGVDAILWHPSGGIPYALSYRLQKGVEQVAYQELQSIVTGVKESPTVRFVLSGHLHVQLQCMFGAIFGAQCGAFEGSNSLTKKKGLTPNIGGYVIKATLNSKGMLKRHSAYFCHFEEIVNDYKNYGHTPKEKTDILKPILE